MSRRATSQKKKSLKYKLDISHDFKLIIKLKIRSWNVIRLVSSDGGKHDSILWQWNQITSRRRNQLCRRWVINPTSEIRSWKQLCLTLSGINPDQAVLPTCLKPVMIISVPMKPHPPTQLQWPTVLQRLLINNIHPSSMLPLTSVSLLRGQTGLQRTPFPALQEIPRCYHQFFEETSSTAASSWECTSGRTSLLGVTTSLAKKASLASWGEHKHVVSTASQIMAAPPPSPADILQARHHPQSHQRGWWCLPPCLRLLPSGKRYRRLLH